MRRLRLAYVNYILKIYIRLYYAKISKQIS